MNNYEWTNEALCSGSKIDFHSENPQVKAQAKELCFSCPVRKECLQDALDTSERWGIRGGVDAQELRKVQAINAEGKPFIHANRPIRCPYCGPWSTKYLTVLEHKRTRTHVQCTKCSTNWWTRKVISKKQNNW